MPDVLIVDDDPSVRDLLTMYFAKDQFTVRTAANGEEAVAAVAAARPSLIILDIMMPGKDGYEVCRELRAQGTVPIIFLTARDDEVEPIVGLEMGADDYVTKPFNARELVARARAVLRRSHGKAEEPPQQVLTFPQFEINPTTREARVNGALVALTPHEFDIIYLLCTRPRQVFPRAEIMSSIWGYDPDYGDYRTVDTHLKRARQKLREAGMTACTVETVWGIGYRFVPPES
ncbi:response regulator transcription factor [bacterium]|nr:response regulator transcription factor [bacterium]